MCSFCVLFIICPWSFLYGTCLFFVQFTTSFFCALYPHFTSAFCQPHSCALIAKCLGYVLNLSRVPPMFCLSHAPTGALFTAPSWCVLFATCSYWFLSLPHVPPEAYSIYLIFCVLFTTCHALHCLHCSCCAPVVFLLCPELAMCSSCVLFTRCSWSVCVCSVEYQCLASGLTRY